jgi:hypothetical protein
MKSFHQRPKLIIARKTYPLKHERKDAGPRCPKHVIEHRKPIYKVNLPREPVKEGEIELTED